MSPGSDERAQEFEEFMNRFGSLYEHSPWISEQVFEEGNVSALGIDELHLNFRSVVMSAAMEQQFELLNSHPELACSQDDRTMLTAESRDEQSAAGLDQCTEEEFHEFSELNQAYREKFGYPFIVAVKGCDRQEILEIFRERLGNDPESEFVEALRQVCWIGRFRLEALFDEQ